MNVIIAFLAGIISITCGIYSLKSHIFSGGDHGSLQGIVRDARIARPLQLVSVEIKDAEGAVASTVKTDIKGYYKAEALSPGNYVVKFVAPLHREETQTVKIEKGITSTMDIDLVPEERKTQARVPSPQAPTWTEVGTQILQDWLKKKASQSSSRH